LTELFYKDLLREVCPTPFQAAPASHKGHINVKVKR